MKRMMWLACLIFLSTQLTAQYTINLQIKDAKDSSVYLAMHHGLAKFSKDTAQLSAKGKATFNGKTLVPGMYLFVSEGRHLFDFLISDTIHQSFSLTTTKDHYNQTLECKGSEENQAFADFTRWMIERQKKESELQKKRTEDEPGFKTAIKEMNIEYDAKLASIQQRFPTGLLYSLARAMHPITVPDFDLPKSTPKYDSLYYVYYRNYNAIHYWDNFDLQDARLQNTPLLIPAMDRYFDQLLVQKPDTLIKYLDLMLLKCKGNKESEQFVAGQLFNKYMKSDIMGMENVVIHLIDQYYLTGKIHGDDKFLSEIADYANKYRHTLIGKKASNLKMESMNGQVESLYDVQSPYTVVYFYEPNCGHCKKETPKVLTAYNKYKDKGLKAYVVYSQSNKKEWQKYVIENNMQWINVWDPNNENDFRIKYSIYLVPQLFLLDKDKVIIGRRLNAETLEAMLKHLIGE